MCYHRQPVIAEVRAVVFKRGAILKGVLFALDVAAVSVAWLLSYLIRFWGKPVPVFSSIPPFREYAAMLLVLPFVWALVAWHLEVYQGEGISRALGRSWKVLQASLFATALVIALSFLLRQFQYSRIAFLYFALLTPLALAGSRVLWSKIVRALRTRRIQSAIVVGSITLARGVARVMEEHPELCTRVNDVFDPAKAQGPIGAEVLARVREKGIGEVFVGLPLDRGYEELRELVEVLETETVNIRLVPDMGELPLLGQGVVEVDGFHFINVRDVPLDARDMVLKRLWDVVLSFLFLIIVSPIMLFVAILVKLSSRGPIFFRQERIGLDGRLFRIIKFRTMKADAETHTGPVWASADDPRSTTLGRLLRRLSLDELPQLLNVLKGEMSLVGPRPERPHFVEEFKKRIPRYMLRHKVKSGMSGWAQVQGWRGNTSLDKRIECDLYYIQNWSLGLDFKILGLTFCSLLFGWPSHRKGKTSDSVPQGNAFRS